MCDAQSYGFFGDKWLFKIILVLGQLIFLLFFLDEEGAMRAL